MRSVLLRFLAFRRRLGRRPGPNPTPNQATPAATRKCSLAMAQGRAGALAGQLGACRCRWRPGPAGSGEVCAEVGAVESRAAAKASIQRNTQGRDTRRKPASGYLQQQQQDKAHNTEGEGERK